MDLSKSILKDIRQSMGLSSDCTDYDVELLQYINNSISKLNQNGVGNLIVLQDETTTWNDLRNPLQVEGNKIFQTVSLYITLSTKLFFDPPPPSAVQHFLNNSQEILWRLKVAYEEPLS